MELNERLKIQVSKIMRAYPFFSYLLTYCDIKIGNDVPTMGVNKEGVLFINPEWTMQLTDSEIAGVLVHEVLHLVYGHINEDFNKGRDHKLMNVACDLKVNETIKTLNREQNKIDIQLPKGGVIPDWCGNFKSGGYEVYDVPKKDSIDIYRELKKDDRNDRTNDSNSADNSDNNDENGLPEGFDSHLVEDQTKNKNIQSKRQSGTEVEDFWRTKILQAGQHQKARGVNSGALSDLIESVTQSKQDWRQVIQNLVAGNEISDYTWSRPSKRMVTEEVYLPSPVKESVKVGVYIDTSGSVSDVELSRFLGEINGIFEQFSSVEIGLRCFDTHLEKKQEFTTNISKLNIKGRGGTDFRVVFGDEDIDDYNMILVFTDGEAPYPDNNGFDGDVVWCISEEGTDKYVKGNNDVILEID